jgi:hypothetical protein
MRAFLAVGLASGRASAVDPFEIQVYDGTANGPGVPGLELHVNHVAGTTKTTALPELPRNGVTHFTLEPSFGVLPGWEAGAYLQTALRPDGTFDYAGAKARSKFVTTESFSKRWRLGINFEVSLLPERYDRDRWGSEIRPIVAWESPSFLFALNPILDQSLAGSGASDGPRFEPAALATYKVANLVGFGFEYYADLGPIGNAFSPLRRQEHYLYEVVNVLAIERVEINLGVGEGLTGVSDDLVFKAILGYAWERQQTPPP